MNKKKTQILILFVIVFYSLWACFELVGKSILYTVISSDSIAQFIENGIIKNLIWTLPAIILVKIFDKSMYIQLKEMFHIKTKYLKYLPIFIIFTICILGPVLLKKGHINLSDNFNLGKIIIVLFVGLTEEMVFRGWLLNATIREDKKWKYIIINAFMFLAIHFPIWIYNGVLIKTFTGFGFLCVLILSIIFSWSFVKSRNILIPIFLHMYWDLLIFMFV
ncbi:MAG TPA: CPBP family intramembrane metalloprotease [Clostridia bacterium]|nr:CPBP family intramembrane metalloprotease [Clostridia bacterium]